MANPNRRLLGESSGFTLLEVLFAMAIMVVAFASILMIQSASLETTTRAREMNIVSMLAKNAMVEAEQAIEGKSFTEVKKGEGGTFKAPYESYRWQREIKEIKFPNFSMGGGGGQASSGGADAGKAGAGSGGKTDMADRIAKLITNFLSKSIREVSVTIFWKRGNGEKQFTVTTYWVDLNREFEITE